MLTTPSPHPKCIICASRSRLPALTLTLTLTLSLSLSLRINPFKKGTVPFFGL